VYRNKVNKLKPTSLLLHQPLSQPAVLTMWNAGTHSDGMCYHRHKLLSLPDVLHILYHLSSHTHSTPFRKGHLAILSPLATFPSRTIATQHHQLHMTSGSRSLDYNFYIHKF